MNKPYFSQYILKMATYILYGGIKPGDISLGRWRAMLKQVNRWHDEGLL